MKRRIITSALASITPMAIYASARLVGPDLAFFLLMGVIAGVFTYFFPGWRND